MWQLWAGILILAVICLPLALVIVASILLEIEEAVADDG